MAAPAVPLVSSASGPWRGFLLEQHSAGQSVEFLDVMAPEHVVVVQSGPATTFEWRDDGAFRTVALRPGQALLIPAMQPFSYRATRTSDAISIAIDPRFLRCVAHDLFPSPEGPDLRVGVPLDDPLLAALIRALLAEARCGFPGGRGYGETLGTALAAHLVRHYSGAKPVSANGRGLARHQMRRVVEHIDAHLDEDLPLATLAAEAGLSPFHFARRFKLTTGVSPHRYLVRCRVERAREMLLGSQWPTSEIARRVGFCDQSHLTAHFRRTYGVTPLEFRRRRMWEANGSGAKAEEAAGGS